jgi:hypothetical protein
MVKKAESKEQLQLRQRDETVFRDGQAIFSQDDLRELVNTIYSGYQYRGAQQEKLARLIDFLELESNKFRLSDLADQNRRLSIYLSNFLDFLKNNFCRSQQDEEVDPLYLFKTEETPSETEAFLIEFQMVSMDVEKAYRDYHSNVMGVLGK